MESTDSVVTIINPGLFIDGLGGPPQGGIAVILRGSSIHWVGPKNQLNSNQERVDLASAAGENRILDLPESTLLPGLIDCHTHTNMPGDGRTGEEVNRDTDDVRLLRAARNVGDALKSGVTTLCDCGSWNRTAFSLKEGLELGLVDGPRVMVAGPPLTITGGHLWYMGGEADGVDGVRQQVRQLIKQGADIIKIAASGGSTLTSDPNRPSYSLEEVRAITDEAHNRTKPVAAHCRSIVSINNALDAGVDMILHCFFADPDGSYRYDEPTSERLADSGVWINPTHALGRRRQEELLRKKANETITVEEQAMLVRMANGEHDRKEQFRRLADLGARFIGGSDCGWSSLPFGQFQIEVESMTEFGLFPMQAILAATRDAAAALGKSDTIGTIEPGKEADLLLVEGNPVEDMDALSRVAAVYYGGRPVRASAKLLRPSREA